MNVASSRVHERGEAGPVEGQGGGHTDIMRRGTAAGWVVADDGPMGRTSAVAG